MKRGAALGLAGSALAGYGALASQSALAQSPSGKLVSWVPSGQRWELPQRAVYELFKVKFPDIEIEWIAEPISDYIPKTVTQMAAKSDKYDILHDDYQVVPSLIALGALEPIESYLDKDPDFNADILADVPENVMDLYRDKTLAEGGTLYGLPPDSNCQLQYYRSDLLEKLGAKPAETWDDAIALAAELNKQTGTTLKRGLFAGTVFITILRCYGGDWFDKMEKGFYTPTLNTDPGHSAMDIIMKLKPSSDSRQRL